jgi:Flp pilus assembly pilin Flp
MEKKFWLHFRSGQGLVEYGLLLSLLVIGMILVLSLGGVSLSDIYCSVASGIGGGGSCNEQQVYCQDSFDGDLSTWQPINNTMSLNNGQLCFGSGLQSMNKCSMKLSKSDYVIKMDAVSLSKGDGYGAFFRSTINSNGLDGYVFQYDPGWKSSKYPNGAFLIRRWINGREVSNPIAVTPIGENVYNTPHNFEINVSGDTYTVFMDGKKVLSAQDSTYTTGGTGIRSWDSTSACIGDFSVLETP